MNRYLYKPSLLENIVFHISNFLAGVKKPYFTEPLKDQVVAEGAGVRLSATFGGEPEPNITWLRNNNPIQSSAVFRISVSGNTTVLDINGVYPEDMGTYTVVARNMAGETRTSCNLRVEGVLFL